MRPAQFTFVEAPGPVITVWKRICSMRGCPYWKNNCYGVKAPLIVDFIDTPPAVAPTATGRDEVLPRSGRLRLQAAEASRSWLRELLQTVLVDALGRRYCAGAPMATGGPGEPASCARTAWIMVRKPQLWLARLQGCVAIDSCRRVKS